MTFSRYVQMVAKRVWQDSFSRARAAGFFIPMTLAIAALFFPQATAIPNWWLPAIVLCLFVLFNLILVPFQMVNERDREIQQQQKSIDQNAKKQAARECLAKLLRDGTDIYDRDLPPGYTPAWEAWNTLYVSWRKDVSIKIGAVLTPTEVYLFDSVMGNKAQVESEKRFRNPDHFGALVRLNGRIDNLKKLLDSPSLTPN